MTQGLSGFVNTWGYAWESTENRVELRNVRQGGNDFLAAVPLALQSMWAGMLMSEVAEVVSGPLWAIAQFFRVLFNGFISFPLSIFACATKEGFYESSLKMSSTPMTKFYECGDEVAEAIKGTVTLLVGGRERHFALGDEISWYIKGTFEENGKRYWYHRLEVDEVFDDQCREVEINGVMVRIKLEHEASQRKFVQIQKGEESHYYELNGEVSEPVIGTISVPIPHDQIDWQNPVFERYYLAHEIPNEAPNCMTVSVQQTNLFYDTGEEIDAPTETSHSFLIDGTWKHFATAKYARHKAQGLSGWLNKITEHFFHCSILPTRLNQTVSRVLRFVNQHLSDIIRVAIIAAGIALLFFGHIGMAAGALTAVTYEYLDHDLGMIPQDVSLFMEKWLPTISMVGLLITGSAFTQMIAGITLLLNVPQVQLFIHQKVARIVREAMMGITESLILWYTQNEGRPHDLDEVIAEVKAFPQLEEVDAPLIQRREMALQEIREILDADVADYELNPASFSKNVEPHLQLEEDKNFQKLMDLWDRVGDAWLTPPAYLRILKRLADDKRFILFLKERFPEAKRFYFEYDGNNHALNRQEQYQVAWGQYLVDIKGWIAPLAQERGKTKEQFVADWAKEQLEHYANKINGNRPIEGEQRYLRDAIENTSKILPFLTRDDVSQVDLEDALLKLAVEGGDYCSLAMWRASGEILQGFIAPLLQEIEEGLAPNELFEHQVIQEFQKARLRAIQGFYQQVASLLKDKEQFQDVADDIHLYMAISRAMKRGFYPMTQEEMDDFSMAELLFTETMLLPLRVGLQKEFEKRIPYAMNALGIDPQNPMGNRCLDYLRAWVQENPRLTDQEKIVLLNSDLSLGNIVDADFYPKWHRLMLTIVGIYRKKPVLQAAAAPAAEQLQAV